MLPERNRQAEDRFLERWRCREDAEALQEVISAAMQAGRPQLAARLVGLLGEQVQVEPGSAIARACQAARLVLVEAPAEEDVAALEQVWLLARRRRIKRITERMRSPKLGALPRRQDRTGRKRRR